VYAKQKLSPRCSGGWLSLCLLLAFFLIAFPRPSRADSLEDAAAVLARKVCAPPRPRVLKVQWAELPISASDPSDPLKHAFLAQLSACGVDLTEDPDGPVLNVTVQLTASKIVLVADFLVSPGGRRIQMVEIPRSAISPSNVSPNTLRLRRELLWQQEGPIDGAVERHDRSTQEHFLFLLSQGLLIRMRLENFTWRIVDSAEIPSSTRGYRMGKGTFVYDDRPPAKLAMLVDGKVCSIEIGEHISFACRDAGPVSKAVTIASACDDTFQSLGTGRGDYTQRDRITLTGTELIRPPLSEEKVRPGSVEVPGPVLDITSSEDAKTVAAVVKNLSTGNYEVYRITTACGD
jgi:hypothetical protein